MTATEKLVASINALKAEVALDLAALQNLPNNDDALNAAAADVDQVTAQLAAARATLVAPTV